MWVYEHLQIMCIIQFTAFVNFSKNHYQDQPGFSVCKFVMFLFALSSLEDTCYPLYYNSLLIWRLLLFPNDEFQISLTFLIGSFLHILNYLYGCLLNPFQILCKPENIRAQNQKSYSNEDLVEKLGSSDTGVRGLGAVEVRLLRYVQECPTHPLM